MNEDDAMCGIPEDLTFEHLRGMTPRHGLDDIPNAKDPDGNVKWLGYLLSDQCPFGMTVEFPDGTDTRVTGCILSHANDVMGVISPFNPKTVIEGSKSETFRFPRMALYETLTNAVAHRDYSVPGDIRVTLGDSGISVQSPGSAFRDNRGIRNPDVVAVLELFRLKGHYRNGLDVIRKTYSRTGTEPRFVSTPDSFVTTLPVIDRLVSHYQAKTEKVVCYMRIRGGVTFDELTELLHISKTHMRDTINRMEDEGLIFDMFAGGMRRYYLCHKSMAPGQDTKG